MPPKLKRVVRLDSMPLSQTYFTPEGYLKDCPILTSTGIFEYSNPDGSVRRELRLPQDVFDPKSLESYKGKPIIITHDAGLVTKDNVHKYQIGTILSDGKRSGDDVKAEIIIHNTDEMKEAGLKELSLGYNLDLEETKGVWHGEHYDAIQKNIRINHLALVREARAGEQARLNIDGRDAEKNTLIGGKKMKNPRKATRHNDGVLSPDELQKAIEQYKKNRKASQVDADDVEDEVIEEVEVKDEDDAPIELPDKKKVKDVEERVQFVKDRRDRRDEEGDPEDTDEAMGIIANQDEDIDYLFDIIDTLLAERDFKATSKDAEDEEQEIVPEEMEEDEIDDLEKLKGDADDEEEMLEEDEDDVEELPEDEMEEDEDDVEEELTEEELEEDEDDVEELPEEEMEEDEDDLEEEMDGCDDEKRMNADSVDAIVRERIQLGIIGNKLHLDGLENRGIRAAKKAVIRKVNPNIRLDGKSSAYIDAAYDCAVAKVKKMKPKSKKTVSYQKKQMFNKDSRTVSHNKNSADAARQRMIARQMKNK